MKRQSMRKTLILISFFLFPVTIYYLSPALPIEGAFQGIASGSLVLFALLFLSSLICGRAFCGWVCPAAGLQEACFGIQNKRVVRGYWVKYLIWGCWMAVLILAVISAKGIHALDPFFATDHGISIAEPSNYIIYYSVIALIFIPALGIGKRSFCHSICWMAPFMVLGMKIRNWIQWPALHLETNPERCSHCQRCTRECPMSLEVETMAKDGTIANSECILCGNCVDTCPKMAIHYAWMKKRSLPAATTATRNTH
ncbi:MAG TPA: 4Fe-4S dicluster domain-containing protein [Bacillota bacterium]